MTGRTYVQGCGYHETAYGPPDVVAEFLEARGFQVEVIQLDKKIQTRIAPHTPLCS